MQIEWKKITGTQAERPAELDTTSSPNTVYLRKNIEEVEIESGGSKITAWSYDEAQLTIAEYEQYKVEAKEMETLGYVANKDNQEVLMEAVADTYVQQLDIQENQLIIMDAISEIYELLGKGE